MIFPVVPLAFAFAFAFHASIFSAIQIRLRNRLQIMVNFKTAIFQTTFDLHVVKL